MKFNACSREPKDTSGPEPDLPGRAEECGYHWGNEWQTVVWSLFQNS
ncbi:hypothetical protein NXV95_17480 [Bacteroides fragilis]|nr:hypothetical protein [Bacteroides fragilis]